MHTKTHLNFFERKKFPCFIINCNKSFLYTCTLKNHMITCHQEEYEKLIEEYPDVNFYDIFKNVQKNEKLKFVNFEVLGSVEEEYNNKINNNKDNEKIESKSEENINNSNSSEKRSIYKNLSLKDSSFFNLPTGITIQNNNNNNLEFISNINHINPNNDYNNNIMNTNNLKNNSDAKINNNINNNNINVNNMNDIANNNSNNILSLQYSNLSAEKLNVLIKLLQLKALVCKQIDKLLSNNDESFSPINYYNSNKYANNNISKDLNINLITELINNLKNN